MFEEIKNIKTSNKDFRSFGIIIGIILIMVAGLLFYYEETSYQIVIVLAGIFIGFGITIPILLKPVYLIWMTFAIILGWVMTRVILSIVFYLIITPIGLITRLLGEDFLGLKRSNLDSFWNNRDNSIKIMSNNIYVYVLFYYSSSFLIYKDHS